LVLTLALSMQTGRGTTISALVAMIDLEVQVDFRKEAIKGVDTKVTATKARMAITILMAKRVISNAMSAHHAVSSASLGTSSAIVARHAILIGKLVITHTMVTHRAVLSGVSHDGTMLGTSAHFILQGNGTHRTRAGKAGQRHGRTVFPKSGLMLTNEKASFLRGITSTLILP